MAIFVKGLVYRRVLLSFLEMQHPDVGEDENEPYEITFNVDEISSFEEFDEENYLVHLKNPPFDIEDFLLTSNRSEIDSATNTD